MTHAGPIKAALLLSIALHMGGCFEIRVPYGYDKIKDSDRYVQPGTLAEIEQQRLSRQEVIALLGEPDVTDSERRAIGYERCVSSSGKELVVWMIPVWSKNIDYIQCERIGVWFDAQDRTTRTKVSTSGPGVQRTCMMNEALEKTAWWWESTCW